VTEEMEKIAAALTVDAGNAISKMHKAGLVGPGASGMQHLATVFGAITALAVTLEGAPLEMRKAMLHLVFTYFTKAVNVDLETIIAVLQDTKPRINMDDFDA